MNYPPKEFYNINLVIVIPVHFEVRTGSGSFCLLINEVICRSIEPSYHSFFLSLPSIYWSSMSTIKSRLLSFKNESMLALLCSWNNWKVRVGALVQWLWEETLAPKVVGSNPSTVYWMDIFSHLFVVTIVMFVWKDENKRKDPRIAHFLNEKLTKQGPDPRMFSVNFLCVELMILNWLKTANENTWKQI